MRVRDIMCPDPKTTTPTTAVWAAFALMREEDIRHLPVVDGDDVLQGVLSSRDAQRILDLLDVEGRIPRVWDLVVSEIMTTGPGVVTAPPEMPRADLVAVMLRQGVGCVPVVDPHRRVIGLVTDRDVLRDLVQPLA